MTSRPATAPSAVGGDSAATFGKRPPVRPVRRLKGFPPQPESTLETQLSYSARNRDYKGCIKAIQAGANVNAYEDGDNPLHWAAFWGDREIAQILLEAGADPGLPNQFNRAPLEDAYREKQRDVALLLELWRKKDTATNVIRGRETMESAVRKQQPEILRNFLESNRGDYVMQIHVETAETALAKIMKEQERACAQMRTAATNCDIDALEVAVEGAKEIVSLIGPPVDERLATAQKQLEDLLHDENVLRQKLQRVTQATIQEAPLDALDRVMQSARTSHFHQRLASEIQDATDAMNLLKGERDSLERKLNTAVQSSKRGDDPRAPEAIEALEGVILEVEPVKCLKGAVSAAQSYLSGLKATPTSTPRKK